MPASIFSDEWRQCLVAHYTHTLRSSDHRTERSLRGVMLDIGFSEDDLNRLYIDATAHVDDVPNDFIPDSRFLESILVPESILSLTPTVPSEPSIADAPPFEAVFDDVEDSQELLALDESEIGDDLPDDEPQDGDTPPPADPDATQLSLF